VVIPATGRLLVSDPILPSVGDLVRRVLFDVGRDRTAAEVRALFAEAAFSLARVESGARHSNLWEAIPA
jgi:hypothetical protein